MAQICWSLERGDRTFYRRRKFFVLEILVSFGLPRIHRSERAISTAAPLHMELIIVDLFVDLDSRFKKTFSHMTRELTYFESFPTLLKRR